MGFRVGQREAEQRARELNGQRAPFGVLLVVRLLVTLCDENGAKVKSTPKVTFWEVHKYGPL